MFQRKLLTNCARWSQEAYSDNINRATFLNDTATDTQAHLFKRDYGVIVAFRGSESIKDWYHDMKTHRTRVPWLNNCRVHTGFLQQYSSIRRQIIDNLQDHSGPIIFTGHSLGGALATIAALDFALQKDQQITCCTFGSPRVGDSKFCALFDREVSVSTRCIYKKDPITFVPSSWRFKHVRGGTHLTDSKIDMSPPFRNCWSLCGCSPTHHKLLEYINALVNNTLIL